MSNNGFEAVPIFRIFDVANAKESYVDFLGCQVDWKHGSTVLVFTPDVGHCT